MNPPSGDADHLLYPCICLSPHFFDEAPAHDGRLERDDLRANKYPCNNQDVAILFIGQMLSKTVKLPN